MDEWDSNERNPPCFVYICVPAEASFFLQNRSSKSNVCFLHALTYFEEEKIISNERFHDIISSIVTNKPLSPNAECIHSTICSNCNRGIPKDTDNNCSC